jgi:hypothetical protein
MSEQGSLPTSITRKAQIELELGKQLRAHLTDIKLILAEANAIGLTFSFNVSHDGFSLSVTRKLA